MKEESFMNEESVNERCFEERWWEKQQTFLGCPDLPLIMTVTFTLHQYNRCRWHSVEERISFRDKHEVP